MRRHTGMHDVCPYHSEMFMDGLTEVSFILNSIRFACTVNCEASDSHAKTDTVEGAT